MKKFLCSLLLMCLSVSCAWADVDITAENFPDNALRQILVIRELTIGDKDGKLNSSEIAAITSLTGLDNLHIKSLKGIEYLTALESLDCSGNELTSIDVSNNTKLTYLECSENNLETLAGIEYLTELNRFKCRENELTSLDVSNNTKLTYLDCAYNSLASLDLAKNSNLAYLRCNNNDYLTEINVNGCTKLRELYCHDLDVLQELDVSGLTSLVSLDCKNSRSLIKINASKCNNLESIECQTRLTRAGMLSELDVHDSKNLRRLNCSYNSLTELELSNKPELVILECAYNSINKLDLRSSTKLQTLSCSNNQISDLNLTGCTELTELSANWNWLKTLDISNNRKLQRLYCADNSLTELDTRNNASLRYVEFADNQFSALDLNGILPVSATLGKIDGQRIGHRVVEHDDKNTSYPYYVDFNRYMTSSQTTNVIASSVRGVDENNNEFDAVYSDGVARFAKSPSMVRYTYDTGYKDVSFGVTIMEDDYTSLSLHNHVYRIFLHGMRWENAKAYCETLGGHLATVSDEEEIELLKELCRRANEVMGYYWSVFWIGGEKVGYGNIENRWRWVTDEVFNEEVSEDISHLKAGDAAETLISERYFRNLVVNKSGDVTPGYSIWPYGFICEWEPEPTEFAPYSKEYQNYLAKPETYFGDDFRGAIPEPVDYSHLVSNPPVFTEAQLSEISIAAMDTKYDPRDRGTVSPVRNQTHDYRTCWAFAALSSLETSYLHQGYGTAVPDLSELHMAWYTYMDPRNYYRAEMNPYLKNEPVLNFGGDNTAAIAFLARAGTAFESDMPYTRTSELGNLYSGDILSDGKLPEEYSHPLRIKELFRLGAITADNIDLVKSMIKKYGAVAICYDAKGHGDALTAFYHASNKSSGHAVSIVGWDDEYSRENFNERPSSNGAWLAKNSYGTRAGEDGFFWLSYEQKIGDAAVYVAADSKVDTIYGHDTISAKDTIPHNWSAAIFRANNDETLNEVSFHTRNNNVGYEIYINKLGSDDEPVRPGIPEKAVHSGKIEMAGYHTITLSEPLEVMAGDYFSVMLKINDDSEYGKNKGRSAVEDTGEIRSSNTITIAGKSYFAEVLNAVPASSDWKDGKQLYEEGGVRDASCGASIKVFASSGGTVPNVKIDDDNPDKHNVDANDDVDNNSNSSGGGGCNIGMSALVMVFATLVMLMKSKIFALVRWKS